MNALKAKLMIKRSFDVAVTLTVLVVSSPLWLVIAALAVLTQGRPVLFSQTRLGQHGHPFELYKFRTMTSTTDENGGLLDDELRLTSIGRLLRKTTMDELPGLINVLRGEMSIVGPRPLLPEYEELYSLEQWRRHEMKPGMAGPAVARGRNSLSWEDKLAADVDYVDNWSLGLDLKVLALSVIKVFTGQGVSAEGHATMPRFTGTAGGHPAAPDPSPHDT